MVYDLTDTASVDDLENYWITEAYNYCDKNIKVLMLGNKCDADREVKPEVNSDHMKRIKNIAEKYNYISEEVSAKTGEKVFDSIKNFGIAIAKAKMEKSGILWNTSTNTGNSGGNPVPSPARNNSQSPAQKE
jgi:GTPase SAR1 family protein